MALNPILIPNDEIAKKTIINGDVDPTKLYPHIKIAQEAYIKPVIGNDLFTLFCDNYTATGLTMSAKYVELFEDYIQPMIVHKASELFLNQSAYFVTNGGAYKNAPENSAALSQFDVENLVKTSRDLYGIYLSNMLTWFKTNNQYIPEYTQTDSTRTQLVGGWVIPRKNNQ